MEFRPLHEGFGAEVTGFDVMRSTDPADIDVLLAAYDEYELLVFRCETEMPPERQVEITSWFGPIMNSFGSNYGFLSNEEGMQGGCERLPWHFDYTFTETPFRGISLQAVALPPAGTTTLFTSNVANWESLSPAMKERLEGLSTRHRDYHDPVTGAPEMAADHPIKGINPRTGKPFLFVTEYHSERVLELEPDESSALLAELFAHMYAPERVYEHRWRLHDFLLWDNWAIQHCRPVEAELAAGVRSLRRVTNSAKSLDDIIERARLHTEQLLGA